MFTTIDPTQAVTDSITPAGSHIHVDECERVRFVYTAFGWRVYDSGGNIVAFWNLNATNFIDDVLLLPNYVVHVSYVSAKKIVRHDPPATC